MTTQNHLVLYAKPLVEGGYGVAHLASRLEPPVWTRCDRPSMRLESMQRVLDSTFPRICERCAETCDGDDALSFLECFPSTSVHAIVTEGFGGSGLVERNQEEHVQIDAYARVLRPGGHVFCLRPDGVGWHHARFEVAGFEFRGSIVRIGSEPRKVKKTEDFVRRVEFFDLYRKEFDGTVAQCLRTFGTGGLRRVSDERPFADVIHTDDREDFLAQLRRAALPLGVGTILEPYRLRRWVEAAP